MSSMRSVHAVGVDDRYAERAESVDRGCVQHAEVYVKGTVTVLNKLVTKRTVAL